MEEEINIELKLPERFRVVPLTAPMPPKKMWFKGMRVETYMFGWATLVRFKGDKCFLKLDNPMEDGTMAVYATHEAFMHRVPKPKKVTDKENVEKKRRMKRKWDRDMDAVEEVCIRHGVYFPQVWRRNSRSFPEWCTEQVGCYSNVIDGNGLLDEDGIILNGRGGDGLRFVPDVDNPLPPSSPPSGLRSMSLDRCALMPGNVVTAIVNAGKPMDDSIRMWRNSYFVRMRKFGRNFVTCCKNAGTRDEAFAWYKDLVIQYMEDLIEYYGIKRNSVVGRKLEHIADVYRGLDDMDACPDISTEDADLAPVKVFGKHGMEVKDGE